MEARDSHSVPEAMAELFFQRDGKWQLTLGMFHGGDETAAAKALAKAFKLSEEGALERIKQLPESTPAFFGVEQVVLELGEFLSGAGIHVRAEPCPR